MKSIWGKFLYAFWGFLGCWIKQAITNKIQVKTTTNSYIQLHPTRGTKKKAKKTTHKQNEGFWKTQLNINPPPQTNPQTKILTRTSDSLKTTEIRQNTTKTKNVKKVSCKAYCKTKK